MSHRQKLFHRKSIIKKNLRELHQKKTRVLRHRTSIKEDFSQKVEKVGYLKIGDIVSIWSKEEMSNTVPPIIYKGVVFGDGIAYTDLECVPCNRRTGFNQSLPFRQSLFRIEPAYQYGLLNHYKKLISTKGFENSAENQEIDKYKQKLNEELVANEAELELSYGRTITYGERIQLRHLHSNFFITISENIAKEHGCLKVFLDENGSESSWLEIIPSNKLRQEGEPIQYIDKFIFSSRIEKSLFFLHMGVSTLYNPEMPCELNASDSHSLWSAHKYISYTEIKKNPLLVSSGDSFTIFSQTHGGYLSVAAQNVTEMLPANLSFGEMPENVMEARCYLPKKEKIEKIDNLQIFIEKEKSGRSLWELERTDPFKGGVVQYSERFRIRHVATGMYLEIGRNNNIRLKHDSNSKFNEFYFVPTGSVPENQNFVTFLTQLEIRSGSSACYLGVEEADVLESFLSIEKQDENFRLPLKAYVEENNNVINTTFILIDVPELSAIHIYQISRVIPKIVEFYSFLRTWGMLPINEFNYVPDYEYALLNEDALKTNVEIVLEILKALSDKIIKEDQSNSESLIRIQETIKDTGLLDLFLRLAGLIAERIPRKIESGLVKKGNLLQSLVVKAANKVAKGPGQVGEKYLLPLIIKLYSTISVCIKNSPSNCEILKNYDDFLSYQLNFYKSEVSALLKETFKHSVDIMNKISVSQFGIWAEQLTQLNEMKKNTVDQTLVLMILSSFCVYKNKGIKKYQSLIEKNLFDQFCRIKLLQFVSINGEECIGFVQEDPSYRNFLDNNPSISKLYEKSLINDRGLMMIPLKFLNENKPLVNYVAAFVELLSNMCLSRYDSAVLRIQEEFEFTPQYLMDCIKDPNVHIKIRTKFMKFSRVMFIDVDPLMPVSKSRNLCVFWDVEGMNTDFLPETEKPEFINFPIVEMRVWVIKTWTQPHFPINSYENYSKESKLKFTTELLQLTRCLLELKFLNFKDFILIYSSLVKLIFDYSNDSVIKVDPDSHWCRSLRIDIDSFSVEKINLMITLVLKIFKVGNCLRKQQEIKEFMNLYSSYLNKEKNKIQFTDLVAEFKRLSEEYDFSKALYSSYIEQQKVTMAGSAFLNVLKKGLGLSNSSLSYQPELYQLDSCLLGLLFKNSQKKIEVKALNLILENFNHRKNLFRELMDVHLLYVPNQLNVFKAMNYSINTLRTLISRQLDHIEISNLEGEKFDNVRQGIEQSTNESIMECMKQIKSLLMISQPRDHLVFAQGIARSLNLHTVILKFLTNHSLPWIKQIAKRSYIKLSWKNIYKTFFHALFSFAFKNERNRLLIYPYLSGVAVYFGNGVGTSTLISEVLSCLKEKEAIERIIIYIFSLLELNENLIEKPHDLKMLLNLIIDEKRSVQNFVQINVVKALVSSKVIIGYYLKDKVLDFTKYSEEHQRFQTAIVMLLAYCCQNNEFAIKQSHKLLPYNFVMKELINDQISLKLKRAYLHYLGFSYCHSFYERIDYNKLEEFFRKVIIPDLANYRDFIEYLPELAYKEAYKSVNYRKSIRVEIGDRIVRVKEYLDDDEEYIKPNTKISDDEEREALDYFKYLVHAKPWKIEMVSGLLIFIHNLSIDMKAADYKPDTMMQSHLEKVTDLIFLLKSSLEEIAEQHPKLDFDFLIDSITKSASEIPANFKIDTNEQEVNEDCLKMVFKSLGEITKNLGLTAEQFILNKLKISEDFININDLTVRCKGVLTKDTDIKDIFKGLSLLGESISVNILKKEIQNNIKLSTFKRAYSFFSTINPCKEMHLNSNLKTFIEELKEQFQGQDSFELKALVHQVKTNIVDVALLSKDFSIFYKFTRNLELAFNNPEHKVYLLEIFRQMIIIERNSEIGDISEIDIAKRTQQVQTALISVNISELCLKYLMVLSKKILISYSLKLLHELLNGCHIQVKESILKNIIDHSLGLNMFSFFRQVFNETLDRSSTREVSKEKTSSIELCHEIFLFLKLMVSECFSPLQNYLRAQNYEDQRISIDLVSEIVKFISNLVKNKELIESGENLNNLQKLLLEGFNTLTEFCKGPCEENQLTISNNRNIYVFINWFCETGDIHNENILSIIDSIILFLLGLLEGDTNEAIPIDMLNSININQFLKISTHIYNSYIKLNSNIISQENLENIKTDPKFKIIKLVNIGFNITVLYLKFQYKFPQNPKVKLAFSANFQDITDNIHDDEAYNYQEALLENLKSAWQKFLKNSRNVNPLWYDPELQKLKESHLYFTSNIGSVEISFKQRLCKIFFRIPPMCKFLTRKSRVDTFLKVKRNSHQEKIEDFFDKSKIYQYEMEYQQWLGKYWIVSKLVSYWNFYGFLAFFMVVNINITMLCYYDRDNFLDTSGSIHNYLLVCGQLQLVFATLYLISYTIEYFKVIIYRELNTVTWITTDTLEKYQRIVGTLMMHELLNKSKNIQKSSISIANFPLLFKDFQFIYCLIYLIISAVCEYNMLIYSILLLDLIKRNETLINILKSISLNYKQILLTLLFGLFIVYIYSTIYFLAFSSEFNSDEKFYCESLRDCFSTILNKGVRAGGGIGDIFDMYGSLDLREIFRIITDLSFFIIVIIILLNIIFGIIIDTFAELRDQRNDLIYDLQHNCFICGNTRFQFDLKRISWKLHVNLDHSLHSYLAFLVYIRQKMISDCNGVEKYIKEKIAQNNVEFFPRTSISLEKFEEEFRDTQSKVYMKYIKKLKKLQEVLSRK